MLDITKLENISLVPYICAFFFDQRNPCTAALFIKEEERMLILMKPTQQAGRSEIIPCSSVSDVTTIPV